MLAMSAAVSALVLPIAPASAVVEGFSPMSALKGKDYGKSRMTCVSLISAFDLHVFRKKNHLEYDAVLFSSQRTAGRILIELDWKQDLLSDNCQMI